MAAVDNMPLSLTQTIVPKPSEKKISNPYAKKFPLGTRNANVPFVPGSYSAKPKAPYTQAVESPPANTQHVEQGRNGQTGTPPLSQNEEESGSEESVEGFRLVDAELARQSATKTRKKRDHGTLVAKLEIPINQITEELVRDLSSEVARRVLKDKEVTSELGRRLLKDKDLKREILSEILPELAKSMVLNFVEPKQKKSRKSI